MLSFDSIIVLSTYFEVQFVLINGMAPNLLIVLLLFGFIYFSGSIFKKWFQIDILISFLNKSIRNISSLFYSFRLMRIDVISDGGAISKYNYLKSLRPDGHLLMFTLLVLLLPISCVKDKELPEGVIEREKFVEILSDVQIFESMDQFIRNKNTDFNIDYSYQWMFEHYHVSKKEFENSLDYYTKKPEIFEAIYDDVIVRVSEKKVEYTKKSEP